MLGALAFVSLVGAGGRGRGGVVRMLSCCDCVWYAARCKVDWNIEIVDVEGIWQGQQEESSGYRSGAGI